MSELRTALNCDYKWEYQKNTAPVFAKRKCAHCGRIEYMSYGEWICPAGAAVAYCPDHEPIEVDPLPVSEEYKQRQQRFEQDPSYHLVGAEFAANEAAWAYEHGEPDQMWEAIDTARKHLMAATLYARRLENDTPDEDEEDE